MGGHNFPLISASEAMGIDWMTRDELSQAIPPAYSRYLGEALMRHLEGGRGVRSEWLARELASMKLAHDEKVCVMAPVLGKCHHECCKRIWGLKPEDATPEELVAIFGEMQLG